MIIQAELRRKQSEYEGEACVIDKVIELPAPRFEQFSHALLADYDFIAENKNAIQHNDNARHCLLILDTNSNYSTFALIQFSMCSAITSLLRS